MVAEKNYITYKYIFQRTLAVGLVNLVVCLVGAFLTGT